MRSHAHQEGRVSQTLRATCTTASAPPRVLPSAVRTRISARSRSGITWRPKGPATAHGGTPPLRGTGPSRTTNRVAHGTLRIVQNPAAPRLFLETWLAISSTEFTRYSASTPSCAASDICTRTAGRITRSSGLADSPRRHGSSLIEARRAHGAKSAEFDLAPTAPKLDTCYRRRARRAR